MAHPERFHALDTTRAFALLLGVMFHGAWFYTLQPFNTAVQDVEANHLLSWFFHASHAFRMQLFFLIAGFFGRLVYVKRGFRIFATDRFKRIAIPLVVGWLILYPAVILIWVWGGSLSGQNPVDLPPLKVTIQIMTTGRAFVERSNGGLFGLAHLWFLYYLLYFYLLALAGRLVVLNSPLGRDSALSRLDHFVHWLTASPLGALSLVAIMTPALWSMTTWAGVDNPSLAYAPALNTTFVYFGFFLLGWLIHRQADRLGDLFRQWKLYLGVGLLASVLSYLSFDSIKPYEPELPPHSITYRDVGDWPAFRASLAAGAETNENDLALHRLWSALHPRTRGFIEAQSTTFDQRYGILMAVNGLLADPNLFPERFRPEMSLDSPHRIDPSVIPNNRKLLQPYLHGVTAGDYREEMWYRPAKLAYAALYSLMMVSLVYGFLGAFQVFCQGFSPTWRYLADSSYWVYLLHIPLLPAVETLIFGWPITSLLKFPLVCLVSLLFLYASYHYLVRSTLVGVILNGRKHPFHWNPRRAIRSLPAASPKSARTSTGDTAAE